MIHYCKHCGRFWAQYPGVLPVKSARPRTCPDCL